MPIEILNLLEEEPEAGRDKPRRHPQAHQELIRPGQARRWSNCPDHGKELVGGGWTGNKSSQFLALQQDMVSKQYYWAFRCKGKGGHIFLALPDPHVPKPGSPQEDFKEWELNQLKAKAKDVNWDQGGR